MAKLHQEAKALAEQKRIQALTKEIKDDFEKRRENRRKLEDGWLLNMRFLAGDQYYDVAPYGGLIEEQKRFYWQTRRVYNRIAPIIDARMSKLIALRPAMTVKAFSDEEGDVQAAKLASAVLKFAQDNIDFPRVVARATLWAETCGSAFYKVVWNEKGGRQVSVDENGAPVYEGEAEVVALSAFEIFPDRLDAESMDELQSVIHAQIVSSQYVFECFGVAEQEARIDGSSAYGVSGAYGGLNVYTLPSADGGTALDHASDGVLLIERYQKPTAAYPNGRLEIVAGNTLVFEGDLPYLCGERNERGLPFVKQDCLRLPGSFFGQSVINRLIPLQRAYNAVRNRKHEFLNRLSIGIIAAEDGSIDCDELVEEGLAPGKVLVYRQGSQAPQVMDIGGMPAEFSAEEEWLEKEFTYISGVSDLSRSSTVTNVTSASGLQLLLSQDNSRMSVTTDSIEHAAQAVGKQILRLYRQFAGNARLMSIAGEGKRTQVYYFNATQLQTADIRFAAEQVSSPLEKRETLLRLYAAGLLSDEQGKTSKQHREKILDAFGFGGVDNARDIASLHTAKASEENIAFAKTEVPVEEFDDHEIHVNEHTRYLLSADFAGQGGMATKERAVAHLREHKRFLTVNGGLLSSAVKTSEATADGGVNGIEPKERDSLTAEKTKETTADNLSAKAKNAEAKESVNTEKNAEPKKEAGSAKTKKAVNADSEKGDATDSVAE